MKRLITRLPEKNRTGMCSGRKEVKQSILALCVVFSILLTFVGCQQAEKTNGWLDGERLTSFEALYGKDKAAVLETLKLKENEVSQGERPGLWNLQKPVSLQGKEFSQSLLYDVSAETFYGMRYWYRAEDEKELLGLVEDLLKEGNKLYGEPSTYPGLENRLTAEGFDEAFSDAMANGSMADWREEWNVGENTRCTLSVGVVEANAASVVLEYALSR